MTAFVLGKGFNFSISNSDSSKNRTIGATKMTRAFCETKSINIKRTKNIISLFFIWINELKYFLKTMKYNFV